MSQYNDLYIRMNLSDTGEVPRTVTGGTSPDVIPYGTQSVTDPDAFFSQNYAQNVAMPITIGTANNIYVRLMNYADGANGGEVYLYYALTKDLNSPKIWSNNQLKTVSGGNSSPVSADSTGQIVATDDPFTWTPAAPPTGQSYNLIARVVTDANPNPIPKVITDFSSYVGNNGGVGWLTPQITIPPTEKLQWSTTVSYSQGSVERVMQFSLFCSNILVGSKVSLLAANSGTTPPIVINETTVTASPTFQVAMQTDVPVDFTSNITFNLYTQNNQTQPAGSYVKFTVSYMESSGNGPSKMITVFTATTTN
jgi:hypothetical protein